MLAVGNNCVCTVGVKDAVVDAVEELYLKASTGGVADPRQEAQNLVALAQGSSLGQPPKCMLTVPAYIVPETNVQHIKQADE